MCVIGRLHADVGRQKFCSTCLLRISTYDLQPSATVRHLLRASTDPPFELEVANKKKHSPLSQTEPPIMTLLNGHHTPNAHTTGQRIKPESTHKRKPQSRKTRNCLSLMNVGLTQKIARQPDKEKRIRKKALQAKDVSPV